jgi:hypothetical protein
MLARRYGGRRQVADLASRLRCETCAAPPIAAAIVEDPASHSPGRAGAPPGWRVELPVFGVDYQ